MNRPKLYAAVEFQVSKGRETWGEGTSRMAMPEASVHKQDLVSFWAPGTISRLLGGLNSLRLRSLWLLGWDSRRMSR